MGDEQRSITSLKTTAKEWARKVGIDSVDRLNEMIDQERDWSSYWYARLCRVTACMR